jgi:hypothetical protein
MATIGNIMERMGKRREGNGWERARKWKGRVVGWLLGWLVG